MRRHTGYFIMGAFLLGVGINGVVSGEMPGFGSKVSHSRTVSHSSEPIEYTLSLSFSFIVGGVCIWAAFFEK